VQHGNVGASPYRAGLATPQCEVLFELFQGDAGTVHLGRLLRGHDAGRIVALRALASEPSTELSSAVDVSRSIAHPRLTKVLGIVRGQDTWYLASEFIPGVTLFELGQTVARRGTQLKAAVAARIALDALKAAREAQRVLLATAQLEGVRCLFPESIWIAEYGEVFVSEVLVAPLLHVGVGSASLEGAATDAAAAAAALAQLVRAGSTEARAGARLPAELGRVLAAATRRDGVGGFDTVDEFIEALSELDEASIASEEEVGAETLRVIGVASEWRRQRLEMLQRGPGQSEPAEAEATRVFRVAPRNGRVDNARVLEEATVVFGRAPAAAEPPRPTTLDTPKLDTGDSNSTISAVWREARAVMDSPRRKARPEGTPFPAEAVSSPEQASAPEQTSATEAEPPSAPLKADGSQRTRVTRRTVTIVLLAAVAIGTWGYALYEDYATPATRSSPSTTH
jgi:hypothetical protein